MAINKLAVVFPGQGSQSVGMFADIADQFAEIKQTFEEASSVLGYDLWEIVQRGPTEELDKTEHTQPAVLTASCAIWRILQEKKSFKPDYLAGHSLGEYTALVCANSLNFRDAIRLVAARGQYMQEAVPNGLGAMAAIIGLDESVINAICKEAVNMPDEVLAPANFNSIGQIVIAGHRAAVLRAIELAKARGAKLAVLIPVSVPSHCMLMMPAALQLEKLIATIDFKLPVIPILSDAEAVPYTTIESIRAGLVKQLYMPVRWVEIIQYLINADVKTIVECGPGKVLTGLNRRIDKSLELMATFDITNLDDLLKLGTLDNLLA